MSNVQDRIKTWIENHPELVYNEVTSTIYCSMCDMHLKLKKCNIENHVKSNRHNYRSGQPNRKHQFYFDLIIFLISCNIPWATVNHNNNNNNPAGAACGELTVSGDTADPYPGGPYRHALTHTHTDSNTPPYLWLAFIGRPEWNRKSRTYAPGWKCIARNGVITGKPAHGGKPRDGETGAAPLDNL